MTYDDVEVRQQELLLWRPAFGTGSEGCIGDSVGPNKRYSCRTMVGIINLRTQGLLKKRTYKIPDGLLYFLCPSTLRPEHLGCDTNTGAVVGPVMPQVTGTWGHNCGVKPRVELPLPCPGHWGVLQRSTKVSVTCQYLVSAEDGDLLRPRLLGSVMLAADTAALVAPQDDSEGADSDAEADAIIARLRRRRADDLQAEQRAAAEQPGCRRSSQRSWAVLGQRSAF